MSLPGPAWLFCPGDQPDRYLKALAAADLVIIDLEDAVAEENKDRARAAVVDHPLDPGRTMVRVNAVDSAHHLEDLRALEDTRYTTIMVPKVERARDLDALHAAGRWTVVALVETAAGVLNAPEIAAHPVVSAVLWGAEDLIASLNGKSSRDDSGNYRHVCLEARSRVLLSCGAAGVDAVDAVYLDIPDREGLAAEASDAVASGFSAKACIHPTHAGVIRTAFRPTAEEEAWARKVLAAGSAGGVSTVDGQMVDAPLLRQAEKTLRNLPRP